MPRFPSGSTRPLSLHFHPLHPCPGHPCSPLRPTQVPSRTWLHPCADTIPWRATGVPGEYSLKLFYYLFNHSFNGQAVRFNNNHCFWCSIGGWPSSRQSLPCILLQFVLKQCNYTRASHKSFVVTTNRLPEWTKWLKYNTRHKTAIHDLTKH